MSRPDPRDPQPGDLFTENGTALRVIARDEDALWIQWIGSSGRTTVHVRHAEATWEPVRPPLITEPVTLYQQRIDPAPAWWLTTHETGIYMTGRTIVMRPDGTWTEVTE